MPNISPISDLRNYGQVLEKVEAGVPVYLTKNGRGLYSIHSIEDDEALEKARAMVQLMSELNTGFSSGEAEGWVADSELDQRFALKRERDMLR